jgi:phage tail-like protein
MPDDMTPLGGEPTISSYFMFEVDGVQIGFFSEVQGLSVHVAVEHIHEGGQNNYAHQMPGRMTWPHLIFKRGITESDALLTWLTKTTGEGFAANNNKLVRSTGAVTVCDSNGTRLRAWEFDGVYPISWTGPEFSSKGNDPLQEKLEVAHNGFRSKTL